MFIAAAVLSALLAFAALGAGIPKITLKGSVPQLLQEHLGVSASLTRLIGVAEAAAAVGLVAGIFWHPLGIAAAAGLVIVFAGAVVYHGRAGDYADPKARGGAIGPIVLGLVALAAIATSALAI
jgi:hypothetical protein